MKVKYANKETNLRSAIISAIITTGIQLTVFILLYIVLKDVYVTNEYLALFLTMTGIIAINDLSVSID